MGDCKTEEGLRVVIESFCNVCYLKQGKSCMKYFENANFSTNLERLKMRVKE